MTPPDPSDKTPGDLIRALNSPRRRVVLSRLREGDGRASVSELAHAVRDVEQSDAERAAAGESAVLASLWHVHLPKLAEADLVEVDRDAKTVTLRSDERSVSATLDRFAEFTTALGDRHAN